MAYVAGLIFAAFDKKGKEAYFVEDETERTFVMALNYKIENSNWTIMTDDWGYFQRTYQKAIEGSTDNSLENYDVFIVIIIIGVVSFLMWGAYSALSFYMYYRRKWDIHKMVRSFFRKKRLWFCQ